MSNQSQSEGTSVIAGLSLCEEECKTNIVNSCVVRDKNKQRRSPSYIVSKEMWVFIPQNNDILELVAYANKGTLPYFKLGQLYILAAEKQNCILLLLF